MPISSATMERKENDLVSSSADAVAPDPAAALRGATRDACIAASIALLVFAAEQALATLPPGRERDDGAAALSIAARIAAGHTVEPDEIVDAMMLDDAGILITQQMAPAAYLLGTGNAASAPVTGTQALGSGGGSTTPAPSGGGGGTTTPSTGGGQIAA